MVLIKWLQVGDDIDGEDGYDYFVYYVVISTGSNTFSFGSVVSNSGHVQVYKNNVDSWVNVGEDIDGKYVYDWSGSFFAISGGGYTVSVGDC